jgi:hypothetical protein
MSELHCNKEFRHIATTREEKTERVKSQHANTFAKFGVIAESTFLKTAILPM